MRNINLIVIHCSATRCNQRYLVSQLSNDHNARFHNKGIGYHYYIERDGKLHNTRNEAEIGMHALHYNAHSIGICYEGGLDEKGTPADTRTPAQRTTLLSLLCKLTSAYPAAQIMGHSELQGVHKDCPCFSCQEYRDFFKTTTP